MDRDIPCHSRDKELCLALPEKREEPHHSEDISDLWEVIWALIDLKLLNEKSAIPEISGFLKWRLHTATLGEC